MQEIPRFIHEATRFVDISLLISIIISICALLSHSLNCNFFFSIALSLLFIPFGDSLSCVYENYTHIFPYET